MKEAILKYVDVLSEKHSEYNHKHFKTLQDVHGEYNVFGIEWGKKFAKITRKSGGENGQLSVHCFVELATGNIFKSASWRAPAKGVRGNIKDAKPPIFGGDFYKI